MTRQLGYALGALVVVGFGAPIFAITVGVVVLGFMGLNLYAKSAEPGAILGSRAKAKELRVQLGQLASDVSTDAVTREEREDTSSQMGVGSGLMVQWEPSQETLSTGEEFTLYDVHISGSVEVPYAGCKCLIYMSLRDVTECDPADPDDPERLPVFCTINDLTNDSGFLAVERDMTVPYMSASFVRLTIARIPGPTLVMARRGFRTIEVFAVVANAASRDIISQARLRVRLEQTGYGYLERGEERRDSLCAIARLAVTFCAVDGEIARSETVIVRRFLAQHLEGRDDDTKSAVNDTLRETMEDLQGDGDSASRQLPEHCAALRALDSEEACQAAYELCTEIAAADGEVVGEELASLETMAQRLGLAPELAKEMHERHFRTSMFADQGDEALLEMPPDLTREEKIKFLNREYKKWRGRVTHKDLQIAADAELRIQVITRLRDRLSDG